MKYLLVIPLLFSNLFAQDIISVSKGSGIPVKYARSMWADVFLVGSWVTPTPPQGLVTDSTEVFMLEFSSVMNSSGLLNSVNYSVKDSNDNQLSIYVTAKIDSLDNIAATQGTTLVALVIPSPDSGMTYTVEARNLIRNDGVPIDTTKENGWHYYKGLQ